MTERARQTEAQWKCWAYTAEGQICGRTAVAIDPQRGCAVCAVHLQRPANKKGKEVRDEKQQ
jgi:hypothetical protein